MRRGTIAAIALVVLALLALAVVAATGVGLAQESGASTPGSVGGEPHLDVFVPDGTLTPGTSDELHLQVANDGRVRFGAPTDRGTVTTARNVRLDVDADDAPIEIETNRQSIGSVTEEQPRDVPIAVRVPEDAEPGTYEVDVTLRYRHTAQLFPRGGVENEVTRTVTRTVEVEIDDGARFELRGLGSDAQVGDSGTLVAEIENVGGETARNLDVTLESTSPAVALGAGEPGATIGDSAAGIGTRDTTRLDRLDPGERASIEFDLAISAGASARNYSLGGEVRFTDPAGERSTDEERSLSFRPLEEQSFAVATDSSPLRVGETGTVTGTIRNEGPEDVEGVVLVLDEPPIGPDHWSRSYAVGDLAVGESATYRFRGSIPVDADDAPQRLDLTTRYVSAAGSDRTDAGNVRVDVAERRDAIAIEAVDSRFAAGEERPLELQVRNQRDDQVRDVRVRLEVEEPLESDYRSTVVGSLDPGETDTVAFDLDVDSDAPVSQYPATIHVEYLDGDDRPATVRPATVAVEVTETEAPLFPAVEALIFGVLVILVAVAFVWLYRR